MFDDSVCEQKRGRIIDSFIMKANGVLVNESANCKPLCEFSFSTVNLCCTNESSRYKRSDVPLNNLTSATDSVNSTAHKETSVGKFTLTFVLKAELDVNNQSVVTRSRQVDITDVLGKINYKLYNSVEKGEFVWHAGDLLVTAISLDPPEIEFPDLNCADDEVKKVEDNSAAAACCKF